MSSALFFLLPSVLKLLFSNDMIYKNYFYFLLIFSLISCSQKGAEPFKNSQKSIYSFTFHSLNPTINTSIDSVQRVITATMPIGTDISRLIPTIVVSNKAIISPASGIAQDFSKPVKYTVTAEDGTTQSYTVYITVLKSSAKSIKNFVFDLSTSTINASIDSVNRSINATFPAGTDLTKLTPTIRISDRARISPASNQTQDFSNPVLYTVTAEDGTSQTFTVTLRALSAISDQVAQGKISPTKPFTVKYAVCRNEVFFGESGYKFKFSEIEIPCSPYVIVPVSFFIPKLETGSFMAQGPYIYDSSTGTSTSFFGCEVVITKITTTTVEGKLKGGSVSSGLYIEGKFTATICN